MLVCVGGEKGGPGKTTLATTFAAVFAAAGKRVLLVNADAQATAQQWSAMRKANYPDLPRPTVVAMRGDRIDSDLRDMMAKFDVVVVDSGGHDSVEFRASLLVADVLLAPSRPNNFDIWTFRKVEAIVREAQVMNRRLVPLVVTTQVPTAARDKARARMRDTMADFPRFRLLDTIITFRSSYAEAGGLGLTVKEYKPHDGRAAAEISYLMDEVIRHAAEEATHS